MSIRIIEPPELETHREELAAWLKANGIDPNDVPMTRPLVIEQHDNGLHDVWYFTYIRTAQGNPQRDPHVPNRAWAELHSVFVQDLLEYFADFR